MESLRELHSPCSKSLLGRVPVKIASKRHPLRDKDHSGNGPRYFPGFLRFNFWMPPERVKSGHGIVGSEENRLV